MHLASHLHLTTHLHLASHSHWIHASHHAVHLAHGSIGMVLEVHHFRLEVWLLMVLLRNLVDRKAEEDRLKVLRSWRSLIEVVHSIGLARHWLVDLERAGLALRIPPVACYEIVFAVVVYLADKLELELA